MELAKGRIYVTIPNPHHGQDYSVGLLAQILKKKERLAARSGFQFRYLMQQSAHKIDIKPSFNNQKSIINFELS